MRGTAGEKGEREHDERRRAQGLGNADARPRCRRAGWRCLRRVARRLPHEEGHRNEQDPNENADRELRGSPIAPRNKPRRKRRHRHGRHAQAGGYERHRKTAMAIKPRRDPCDHGREEAAGRDADEQPIRELKFGHTRGAARQDEPEAEQNRAAQHDAARAEAVAQRAPREGRDAHGKEIERHGAGDAGAGPAGGVGHGLQENRQREHRPESDAGHQRADRDHYPAVAVVDLHRATFSRRLRVPARAASHEEGAR